MSTLSERKSINVDGFRHGANPIPAASLVAGILATGAVFGTDRETGRLAATQQEQCRLMFENAARILEAAGATFADVLKMTFFLRAEVSRELLNQHWLVAFPDPESRPARHVIVSETLPQGMFLQCDMLAVPGGSRGR